MNDDADRRVRSNAGLGGLLEWLANGERGVSSNTMVTHLTGIDALGRWAWGDHPRDPDDLSRCRKLLERVPDLLPLLPRMSSCSPEWAALIEQWADLCNMMDAEAPDWRDGKGTAPRTYARMRLLIDAARKTPNAAHDRAP